MLFEHLKEIKKLGYIQHIDFKATIHNIKTKYPNSKVLKSKVFSWGYTQYAYGHMVLYGI